MRQNWGRTAQRRGLQEPEASEGPTRVAYESSEGLLCLPGKPS